MDKKLVVSASPFVTNPRNSTRRIMLDVCIALAPAAIVAIWFFGVSVLALVAVCVITAIAAELCYNILFTIARGKKLTKEFFLKESHTDCSAAVTGLLLALNLPAEFPLWGAAVGSVFAIVLVKMVFGGIGRNFANPAIAARIFLFIALASYFGNFSQNSMLDASSSATWLGGRTDKIFFLPNSGNRTAGSYYLTDMLLGFKNTTAIGEVSAVALLVGFIYLLIRKVIDYKLPLYIIGSTFVFALIMDGLPRLGETDSVNALVLVPIAHVFTGGLLFGAIFMATDYATSPNTNIGNLIFGAGIALITIVIRVYASLPEGVSFAILIMNIIVPLIDKYIVLKPFGSVKNKKEKEGAK